MAQKTTFKGILVAFAAVVTFGSFAAHASAAQLIVSPASGTFQVGSTFDVGVYLDTQGQSVNVVEADLLFPPDVLQLVSPTLGQSVFSVWTSPPVFDNSKGLVQLSGGIPNGINVSRGLITTLTFRVKQASSAAVIHYSDQSSILANDGSGTNILTNSSSAAFVTTLPPPEGPIVTSETNPDQTKWYDTSDVSLQWASDAPGEQFSYILSNNPTDTPDNIAEGSNTSALYKSVPDGKSYFHIKALRKGVWGGTTHFEINTDTALPADFSIDVSPSSYTSSTFQVLSFETTDQFSGIDHYETRIIDLTPTDASSVTKDNFFIESTSPLSESLKVGTYDVTVRAYNKIGKYREVTKRISVVKSIFGIITPEGVVFGGLVLSWPWTLSLLAILIALLAFIGWRTHVWHRGVVSKRASKELPDDVKAQLRDLQKYRQKYGKALVALFAVGTLCFGIHARADQNQVLVSPPLVDSVSQNISNQDIFYIGGKTEGAGIAVSVYMQNVSTSDTRSDAVTSGPSGDWLYRSPSFLAPGEYLVWTQSKVGSLQSPPSSQIAVHVTNTAVQFGASRLSYETIYLFLVIILLLVVAALCAYIFYHGYHGRRKKRLHAQEIQSASDSIDRGFAVLRHDIEAELALVRSSKQTRAFTMEEKNREAELLKDLELLAASAKKEIWETKESNEQE